MTKTELMKLSKETLVDFIISYSRTHNHTNFKYELEREIRNINFKKEMQEHDRKSNAATKAIDEYHNYVEEIQQAHGWSKDEIYIARLTTEELNKLAKLERQHKTAMNNLIKK